MELTAKYYFGIFLVPDIDLVKNVMGQQRGRCGTLRSLPEVNLAFLSDGRDGLSDPHTNRSINGQTHA